MSRSWQEEYTYMIEDCEEREGRLSDWERNFISSLREQIGEGDKSLSPKQIETLSNVWEKATAKG